ncbi:MAG: DmsE family decaheme c-type cytochrome [Armatimonadetes bacterium]|nr:DmsE family decaheme c-type cytochrome [Armatimonadota bacterium]
MRIRYQGPLVLALLLGVVLWFAWDAQAGGDPERGQPTAAASTAPGSQPEAGAAPEGEETPGAEAAPEGEETPGAEAAPESEESPEAEAAPEGEGTPDAEAAPEGEETPEAGEATEAEGEEKREYVGGWETCSECHEEIVQSFGRTLHSKAGDPHREIAMDCESCHGPSSLHVEEGGGEVGTLDLRDLSPVAASQQCLKCHEKMHAQTDWRFSEHAAANVSCLDCHRPHPAEKKDAYPRMLADNQPELCYSCHQEQQAQANWPSHHPIREGRILCADCHNPHGAGLSAFQGAPDDRELCLKCHARYRGPFALEHPPVSESCLICHRPHGSVENNLLVTSQTHLCLRCHSTVHNPHQQARLLSPEGLENRLLYFTRCSICHQEVHGTDVGPRFTR